MFARARRRHDGTTSPAKPEDQPGRSARPVRTPSRGWSGPGGGRAGHLHPAAEFRATTLQVCGLWPFAAGTGSPMVGVPVGRSTITGAVVCCDPISWFERAHLISNPSMFVLSLPGMGKSTIVRRIVMGLAAYGTLPMVLGDLKAEYVDLIRALGGQVAQLGRGRGHLNPLDRSYALAAADQLVGKARAEVLADSHGRRLTMICTLIALTRHQQPTDREEMILDRALEVLDELHAARGSQDQPLPADLLQVLRDAPDPVRQVALDRGDLTRYLDTTEGLVSSLMSIASGKGRLGSVFSAPTTAQLDMSRPSVFDLSSLDDGETDLQAAILTACWGHGFGAIATAQVLGAAGKQRQQHYFIVLDELWRALRSTSGMVDRIDALTRLNRQRGVGQAMVSHTLADLRALASESDRAKAFGFMERAGIKVMGALPEQEMPQLRDVVAMSRAEQDMVTSWSSPPSFNAAPGDEDEPPGRGQFLIKVGGRAGIPVKVQLTEAERALNDTNKLWRTSRHRGDLHLVDGLVDAGTPDAALGPAGAWAALDGPAAGGLGTAGTGNGAPEAG